MPRMFVPGPVDVDDEVLRAQAQPMLPHRSQEFEDIFRRASEKAQAAFLHPTARAPERLLRHRTAGSRHPQSCGPDACCPVSTAPLRTAGTMWPFRTGKMWRNSPLNGTNRSTRSVWLLPLKRRVRSPDHRPQRDLHRDAESRQGSGGSRPRRCAGYAYPGGRSLLARAAPRSKPTPGVWTWC